MRKPAFCICENKDADQLRGNRKADQRLCFRYTDSTIHLLSKYKISSLQPSSVAVQPGLCGTWSETPKTGFLTTRLICISLRIDCLVETRNYSMLVPAFVASSFGVTDENYLFVKDMSGPSSFFCMFSSLLRQLIFIVLYTPKHVTIINNRPHIL